jgi:flagellar assembly protein FliH
MSMLIKRLPAAETATARPITWRPSGAPIVSPEREQPSSPPSSAAREVPNGDQISAERVAALQKRIAELETSSEQRSCEARDAGYREGEAAGRAQANAQVQQLLEKLARSIQEIAEARPKLRAQAESDLLALSLAIARKILHRELTTDPDSIAGLIKVCLEKIKLQEIMRIRLHPQHHPVVQQLLTRLSTGVQMELLPDPKLQLGGIVIETTRGEFDASVDVQLKEIERGLTDRLAIRS